MNATIGTTITPKARALSQLMSRAAVLGIDDLTWLANQAEQLHAMRLAQAAEMDGRGQLEEPGSCPQE